MVHIGNDWDGLLADAFAGEGYQKLRRFLKNEYQSHIVYPDMHRIFEALKFTPPQDVKVVILGQDPYHGPNQAHGLSFSVQDGVDIPASLRNIYQELYSELGIVPPKTGNLTPWAKQGVLLLNTVLTVRAGTPQSHRGMGWEEITDRVIACCNAQDTPIVYLLWGNSARAKKTLIDNPNHLILESAHPSPLSAHRGFFGCGHFAACNQFLEAHGAAPIDWDLNHFAR